MKNSIAVIGASGLVGQEFCQILSEHRIRSGDFLAVSTNIEKHREGFVSLETALRAKPEYVFLAVGADVACEMVPAFREVGSTIIDKSDAFRMSESVRLVVPGVNEYLLDGLETLVASPNCTTTQLVMVLAPIMNIFRIKRVVVSTYQSVSGSGRDAISQLEAEREGREVKHFYPHQIDNNLIPACDSFLPSGNTKEEEKILQETAKILGGSIRISATAVRVPVPRCHGMSVNIEFEENFDIPNIRKLLEGHPYVFVCDDPFVDVYPMPINAMGRDKVFVGRIRRDESCDHGLNLWVVADNLRIGAALNAFRIMEVLNRKRYGR